MILTTPDERKALLERSRSIAVVGASPKAERPSYDVFTYLRARGYDAVPINPAVAEVEHVAAYPTIAAYAAAHGAPDIVDVFRKPEDLLPVVDDAIAAGARAIWFQLGVVNPEAIAKADAAGLDVVVDLCMKTEHRALLS